MRQLNRGWKLQFGRSSFDHGIGLLGVFLKLQIQVTVNPNLTNRPRQNSLSFDINHVRFPVDPKADRFGNALDDC